MSSDSENFGTEYYDTPLVFPHSPTGPPSDLSRSLLALRPSSPSSSSSSSSLQRPSRRGIHGDRADHGGQWLGPGSLGRRASGSTIGSSAQSLDGAAGSDDYRVAEQRWSSTNSSAINFYENVAAVNSVGVLEPQQSFGTGYGRLRPCEENIYENICEDCGRLYGTERCGFCEEDPEDRDRGGRSERSRRLGKYSAKFQEFLGNFRIKPTRGSSGIKESKRKLSKSDIVHNVGGFEDVYRTNKSFDLGEICRMRDDEQRDQVLLVREQSAISSRSIVADFDDGERVTASPQKQQQPTAEPAEPREPTSEVKVKKSTRGEENSLLDFSVDDSWTIYENLAFGDVLDEKAPGAPFYSASGCDDDSVKHWMRSLRFQLYDADDDEDSGAKVTYHVKSIPSATFNDVSEWPRLLGGRGENATARLHGEEELSYKVEEFRQNLENSRRRRDSWLREDLLFGDPVVITFGSSRFGSDSEWDDKEEQNLSCKVVEEEEEEEEGTLTPSTPEGSVTVGEKSEFVAGLLNIFESVLEREREEPDSDAIRLYRVEEFGLSQSKQALRSESICRGREEDRVASSGRAGRKRLLQQLQQRHSLAVSLCRVVLTYERRLKVFLLLTELTARVPSSTRKLVLNKRKSFHTIVAMTNNNNSGNNCTITSGSALRESVQIDRYFQFLEANEAMLAARRRRRRKGQLLPAPDPTADLHSTSSNEVSCSTSNSSGFHSDADTESTGIYQHIWTCQTDPEPVYEECPLPPEEEHIYESLRLQQPHDDAEWEVVVDDFAFSKSRHKPPPPVPNRNIRHPLDRYRNVCILYYPADTRVNRIVYNYRRDYIFNYRRNGTVRRYDSEPEESGEDSDGSLTDSSFCESCHSLVTEEDVVDVVEEVQVEAEDDDGLFGCKHGASVVKSSLPIYSIPDCVQYWKFMLLNVNYNDDEEDVIMTEKTIAVIAENIDKTVPAEPPSANLIVTAAIPTATHDNHDSSPGTLAPKTPPVAIVSHLHSHNQSHTPKFGQPGVIRSPSKSQIPASDSPVGTYTSKSTENLTDVLRPQEKEKSPAPKRERIRDKVKAVVMPSSYSNRANTTGQDNDNGLVFGVELAQVERDDKLQVPRFVTECVEILKEKEYIETSGLYRASGNKTSIESIKKKLNEKRSPKKYDFLKKQDVHSLTGSLKLFFRELKSPLIARDVYESCVQKTKDEAETIENIKLSIEKMELINRNTLRYLIRHLRCVHQNSEVNMMNSSNLAIVWGACLFASTLGLMESYENNDLGRINTLVKHLIDHYDKIFYSDRAE